MPDEHSDSSDSGGSVNGNLESLKQKRKNAKSALTRFETFVSKFKSGDNIENLKARTVKINNVLDEFMEIQNKIIKIEGESDKLVDELTNFESSFFSVIGSANLMINRAERLTQSLSQSQINSPLTHHSLSDVNSVSSHVKLPTINIPTFSGAFESWLNFRDTYSSLIHENNSLSNVQKFYYLRSSLADEAAEQIQSLETTEANYEVAWSILKERYENNNLIINSHIDAIFEIPSLARESYKGIRRVHSSIEKNIRSLRVLGVPVDGWDMILINIIMSKLDPITLRDWKGFKISGKIPTIKEMLKFLSDRCQILQGIKTEKAKANNTKSNDNASRSRHASKTLLTVDSEYCFHCKGSHFINACSSFLKLPVKSRIDEARKLHLCLNCLKKRHNTRECRSQSTCGKCSKRHNTVLHLENIERKESCDSASTVSVSSLAACNTMSSRKQVLLATAIIIVNDKDGKPHECRALLDSASQSNFVTENLCKKLKLSTKPIKINISGIGQGESQITKHINLVINSRLNSFKAKLSCLVLPNITTNIPSASFEIDNLNIPDDLRMADPEFFESNPIDILMGASIFWDLLCQGQIQLGANLPTLQKTHFGWIISGSLSLIQEPKNSLCYLTKTIDLNDQMCRFWELEDQYVTSKIDILKNCPLENHFNKNTQVTSEGHMTKLDKDDPREPSYYIPHHPVIKLSSHTTKLRVVFDASAKTTNGKSLNDILDPGVPMQNDLFEILLRFRKYLFVVTADIAKMYRQVLVNDSQRKLQRIIWRFHPPICRLTLMS
ncbi:uncharacterized protein LOC122506260 [Leptopilina heterotoma]|uniref:uncharacterized protein LOC122506260 n=1 Tax=Leptopilina heterotoma TaxID=63436 RepID=UPI001CA87E6B|nr:uncharacterized protein LOC122506260 [Leptopilina heterotoma]